MSKVKRGPWGRGMTPQVAQNADPTQPRLTTSAMIASLAAEGQRTSPAPFGRALVEAALAPDAAGACRAMRAHLEATAQAVLRATEGLRRGACEV